MGSILNMKPWLSEHYCLKQRIRTSQLASPGHDWDWQQKTDEWKPCETSSARRYESKISSIHQFYNHWFSHAASSPAVLLPIKVRHAEECVFQPCVFVRERCVPSLGEGTVKVQFRVHIKGRLAWCGNALTQFWNCRGSWILGDFEIIMSNWSWPNWRSPYIPLWKERVWTKLLFNRKSAVAFVILIYV